MANYVVNTTGCSPDVHGTYTYQSPNYWVTPGVVCELQIGGAFNNDYVLRRMGNPAFRLVGSAGSGNPAGTYTPIGANTGNPVVALEVTNTAPTCSISAHATGMVGYCTVTHSDADAGDSSTATITWGDGATTANAVSGTEYSHTYTAAGNKSVYATAVDTHAASTTSNTVVILADTAPVVTLSLGTPTGMSVSASVQATDADSGDTISARTIHWGDGEMTANCTDGASYSHAYGLPGQYHPYATAQDSHGAVGSSATHDVTITNPAPSLSVTISAIQNHRVTVTITGENPDHSAPEITIYWFGDEGEAKTTGCVSGESYSYDYGDFTGTFGLHVTATNPEDDSAITKQVVLSTAEIPTCSFIVSIDADNQTVHVDANGSQDDVAITAWRCRFDTGGPFVAGVVGQALTHAYATAYSGDHTLTVQVEDANGYIAEQSTIITLLPGDILPYTAPTGGGYRRLRRRRDTANPPSTWRAITGVSGPGLYEVPLPDQPGEALLLLHAVSGATAGGILAVRTRFGLQYPAGTEARATGQAVVYVPGDGAISLVVFVNDGTHDVWVRQF